MGRVALPNPPILVITDRHQLRRPLDEVAAAVFAAGCRWLSLREKDLAATERETLLRRLVRIGGDHGAVVTVHEDVPAAQAAGAAGVHLPAGVGPAAARRALGPKALIGCSAHEQAELALAAAADYATLSPVFSSPSKPTYGPALGLGRFAAAVARSAVPVVALGGVDARNAALCLEAGAAGVAVMGTIMTAHDPAAVMAGLIKSLGAALAARRGAAP
jgi:thiamine-phosphate pyrophosphorylase